MFSGTLGEAEAEIASQVHFKLEALHVIIFCSAFPPRHWTWLDVCWWSQHQNRSWHFIALVINCQVFCHVSCLYHCLDILSPPWPVTNLPDQFWHIYTCAFALTKLDEWPFPSVFYIFLPLHLYLSPFFSSGIFLYFFFLPLPILCIFQTPIKMQSSLHSLNVISSLSKLWHLDHLINVCVLPAPTLSGL